MIKFNELKKYITHDDRQVRQFIVEYFVEGHIADQDIMPLLLDAYENDPEKEEASILLYYAARLPQTVETIKRVYKLQPIDSNAMFHIDNILAYADLELLRQYNDIRPRMEYANKILNDRFYLSTIETANLWNELWRYSESGEGNNLHQFNYSYCYLIIDELVQRNDFPMDKFREKLKQYYPPEYSGWDDTFLSYIAGELRLTEAIPFLIDNLKIDGDFLCEKSAVALAKIGTNEVVRAVYREYLNESRHFRIYSSGVLEKTKVSECEEIIIDILAKEKDITLKTMLANALCCQLSVKGIPLVMNLINKGYDTMVVSLEERMYVNCIINGIDRSELPKWRENIKKEELRRKEAKKKFEQGNFNIEDLKNSFEKLCDRMKETKKLNELYKADYKVGRNDPCPCGSGKKYKKCCLNKKV